MHKANQALNYVHPSNLPHARSNNSQEIIYFCWGLLKIYLSTSTEFRNVEGVNRIFSRGGEVGGDMEKEREKGEKESGMGEWKGERERGSLL